MAWNEALNQARVSENLRLGWLKVIEAFLRFLERIANDRNMSLEMAHMCFVGQTVRTEVEGSS